MKHHELDLLNPIKVVEDLLKSGAQVDEANENGSTALMFASQKGDISLIRLLLRFGANPKIKNGVMDSFAFAGGNEQVLHELSKAVK